MEVTGRAGCRPAVNLFGRVKRARLVTAYYARLPQLDVSEKIATAFSLIESVPTAPERPPDLPPTTLRHSKRPGFLCHLQDKAAHAHTPPALAYPLVWVLQQGSTWSSKTICQEVSWCGNPRYLEDRLILDIGIWITPESGRTYF